MEEIKDLIKQLHKTDAYPEEAMRALMDRKEESASLLLQELIAFVEDYKRVEGYAHIYILYILSYFRDQRAFPYIVKLAQFPADWIDSVLEECVMYDLAKWMISTHDGNLQAVKQVIENETAGAHCRNAALECLVGLFAVGHLSRSELIDYLKTLMISALSKDYEFAAFLVEVAVKIYPEELYEDIVRLYELKQVDSRFVTLDYVHRVLQMGYEQCLQDEVYGQRYYFTVEQIIEDTSWSHDDWNLDCLRYPYEHKHAEEQPKHC